MASWVAPALGFIVGLIAVGVTTAFVIRTNRAVAKIDISPNAPIIDMTNRRKFTGGFGLGLVKKEIMSKNDTTTFEVYPMDYDQGEEKPRPDMISFVIANQFIKRFARSDRFNGRELIKILPRSKIDIPEELWDTDETKWEEMEGQKAWLKKAFGTAIPAGDEAIHEHMRNWSRGKMTKSALAQIREENSERRKMYDLQDKKEEGKKE